MGIIAFTLKNNESILFKEIIKWKKRAGNYFGFRQIAFKKIIKYLPVE